MPDDTQTNIPAEAAPSAATETPSTCKVRCITDLRPWANVLNGDRTGLRPLEIDEIVTVPANEGPILQKNRHAIIVG